jgi:hypothetical protein
LIAVALVAGVGSFVDWRKEIAFVAVKIKQMEKNVVSITITIRGPLSFKLLIQIKAVKRLIKYQEIAFY